MKKINSLLSLLILALGLTSWGCKTPTEPVVTPTTIPPPTVDIVADSTEIVPGTLVTISWISTNAISCEGIGFSVNTLSGKTVVIPKVTTTYSVVATGPGGKDTASVTVVVKEVIGLGNYYHGGIIFYVDSTGQHGKYFIPIPGFINWDNAMAIAASKGGSLPTIDQLGQLYLKKDIFNLNEMVYWSSTDGVPGHDDWTISMIFNYVNQPEFNGQLTYSLKTMINSVLVICSF